MAPIAFVSTYPPRRCGIATFTTDLGRAMGPREIVALAGPDDIHRADRMVHHTIRTDVPADHAMVARSLADCGIGLVSVQHEYGIWGGSDGEGVLDFLDALSVPAVATLHTVLRNPSFAQRRIMQGVLRSTAAVVVMSQAAATILVDHYSADPTKVEVIPHGVPDVPFVEPDTVKPTVGLQGRNVLLSFGLVGPGKGYELVIEAMPAIVRAVPDACYVILGATHPDLLRTEGERYRTRLQTMVSDLGMTDHVMFIDRFVGQPELVQWLTAADLFVTPYPNLDQIVSGTLSYAMAAGKATVSTPYLYAAEILADGRGTLVPSAASEAMASAIVELLTDHVLRGAMAQRAYHYGRGMLWQNVATLYERLFARVLATHGAGPALVAMPAPPAVSGVVPVG